MKQLMHVVDEIPLNAAEYASARLDDLATLRTAWYDALRSIYDFENGRGTTEQNAKDAIEKAEELERKFFA